MVMGEEVLVKTGECVNDSYISVAVEPSRRYTP